jgi:hypothetical protein
LVLLTSGADVVEHAPTLYQEVNGQRQAVPGQYLVRDASHVSFQVGAYDRSRSLVIDPALNYSTYLGGSGQDYANAIAVDSQGNAYVTGETTSTSFPTTAGVIRGSKNTPGQSDAFVTKLNPNGALVYSTYVGGSLGNLGNGTEKGSGALERKRGREPFGDVVMRERLPTPFLGLWGTGSLIAGPRPQEEDLPPKRSSTTCGIGNKRMRGLRRQ